MRIAAALALLAWPAVTSSTETGRRYDFESDPGFDVAKTGPGPAGRFRVVDDPHAFSGAHVLLQEDGSRGGDRFLVALAPAPALADVRARVACKPIAGVVDRACGLVVRYREPATYYLTRANALEGNVRLYKVVNGRRTELAGQAVPVASGEWQTISLEAVGDHLRAIFGDAEIEAIDSAISGPGKSGVWTKADSVTAFDDLVVCPRAP